MNIIFEVGLNHMGEEIRYIEININNEGREVM